ncbi:amidohydrolase [uncultured Paludibaculum sp.]|uniref:amidohydrolase n=1 Tax=uncultured Paludibaculum sp. TaxID=1765020 RepID=UPI002AAC494E|nr:amidohydrolase [uncultured Paludibaculum sp.]
MAPSAWTANADLILHNGKILTVDAKFSVQSAVAITGGRIAMVGSDTAVLAAERGPKTVVTDLHGATVLPGLFDSHVHPLGAGLSEFRGKLPVFDSYDAIRQYIRAQAARTPKGQWIIVPRTFPTRLRELRMPTRELLDETKDHPVMFDASYVVVVNSLGLKVSGITRDTPNPPRGEIVHDRNGEPNGIIRNAQHLLKGLKEDAGFTLDEKRRALEEMLRRYVEAGLTSIGDGAVYAEEIGIYRDLKAAHRLPLRVTLTARYDAGRPLDDLRAAIQALPYKTNDGDDWLRFGAFKVNVDGGMTIGTAYQRHPYGEFGAQLYGMTNADDRGQLFESAEKLLEIFRTARDKGWTLSAHCQGGGAIDNFIGALAQLDKERSVAPTRSHLIHASFQNPHAIAEMKRLGLLADVQPAWLYFDSPGLQKTMSAEAMKYFFPLRSYIDAGIIVAGGSDHMIGHDKNSAVNPYNPFQGMWNAVTRRNILGEVVHPEQRVTREEALRMYTIWAAYRHFAEKSRGSLEAGKLADLVVIDHDYLKCPIDEIRQIEPTQVMIEGRTVYTRR